MADGPALPAPRNGAALATLNGTAYLIGGTGPDGTPTDTVWSIGLDPDTSALTTWKPVAGVTLPAPRSGATAVAVPDGIVVLGGRDKDKKVTATVWKSTVDSAGKLGAFKEQPSLIHPVANASAAFQGTFVWIYGGSDDNGPTASVQRADYGTRRWPPEARRPPQQPHRRRPRPRRAWSRGPRSMPRTCQRPRSGGAGFAANGALYLVGGSDASGPRRRAVLGAAGCERQPARRLVPSRADRPAEWPRGCGAGDGRLERGPDRWHDERRPVASSVRASTAPQAPFFQLGLVGLVVPGLQIGGQIGQQLGYLAAAGVGTGNFVLLVALGWAFNHKPQIAAWRDRRRRAREAKAPDAA